MTVTEPVVPPGATAAQRHRVALLDGLRGIAILLVVLSHLWTLYALPEDASQLAKVLLSSGNFAVNIFFVIGGYLATNAMLRSVESTGTLRFGVVIMRRWIRLSAHVYPLVLVILTLTAVDPDMRIYAQSNTNESLWALVTYTWPRYMEHHALDARPDLGNLWYVAADLWGIALVALVVFILRRHRLSMAIAMACLFAAVVAYRHHVLVTDGPFIALIQIACRIDALLAGAFAAVVARWTQPHLRSRPEVLLVGLALLFPLMFWVNDVERYLGLPSVPLNFVLAVAVSSIAVISPPRVMLATVGRRSLRFLGRHSLGIYVWHYPVFWYVAHNYADWRTAVKILAALIVTAALSVLVTLVVERPVQSWLRSEHWSGLLEAGIARTLFMRLRGVVRRSRRDIGLRGRRRAAEAGNAGPEPASDSSVASPADEL
jgi:peptidoglycan/LPS O-acetylase OafA/YrhL